jgi:hypothetical protein
VRAGDHSRSGSIFHQSFCTLYLQLEESEGWRPLSVLINLSPVLLHPVPAAGGEWVEETTPGLDQSFPSPPAIKIL